MSNQQAIDTIDSLKRDEYLNGTVDYNQGYNNALKHARNLIQSLPSEWISVEERLPEDYTEVLVYGPGFVLVDSGHLKEIGEFEWDCHYLDYTHWQPLPTPPIPNQP